VDCGVCVVLWRWNLCLGLVLHFSLSDGLLAFVFFSRCLSVSVTVGFCDFILVWSGSFIVQFWVGGVYGGVFVVWDFFVDSLRGWGSLFGSFLW
jgi:hypothetical protein